MSFGQGPDRFVIRGADSRGALRSESVVEETGVLEAAVREVPVEDMASTADGSSGTRHLSRAYIRSAVEVMAAVADGLQHAA